MKVSEMIKHLEMIREQVGDVDICQRMLKSSRDGRIECRLI